MTTTEAPPREAVDLAAGNVVIFCTVCDADRGAIPVDPDDLTATPWRCSWQREHGGHLLPCPDCGDLFTYLHECEATR